MPNKIYLAPETTLTWTDTGGDYAMDLGGLAADGVRVGAQGDLGAGDHSHRYFWQVVIDGFDTAPVVGEEVHIYLAFANDATDIDGDVGASDAAGATADLPNLLHIGTVVVQTTTAADELITSGIVEVGCRYVSPVVHNDTADALLSTADAHTFKLTPIPPEIQ
jgi:hypothetical protein